MTSTRVGEVIEAGTTLFTSQSYELYRSPPLGSLVKTTDSGVDIFGVVCEATTEGIEPGRRPIARGRDEATQDDVYKSNPQLARLLRTEFSSVVVGHGSEGKILQYLAPRPARIHGFVLACDPEEIRAFSSHFNFLTLLVNTREAMPIEEVVAAALRQMSAVYDDPRAFLVSAGKELAIILGADYGRLRTILERIRP